MAKQYVDKDRITFHYALGKVICKIILLLF